MAKKFKTYSFANANAIFGTIEFEEFAEGDDVMSIEFAENQFNKTVGAKGDVIRTQTNDNSCTVTVKLMQTSNTNKLLTAIYNGDVESGSGILPFIFNDKETGETFVVTNAWISKYPIVNRGQAAGTMEWNFEGDKLVPFIA